MIMNIVTKYIIETRLIDLELAMLHKDRGVRLCHTNLKMLAK